MTTIESILVGSKKNKKEKIKKLISKGENIDKYNHHGETLLYLAVLANNVENVKILLDCGAKINIACRAEHNILGNNDSPLKRACINGYEKIFQAFIDAAAADDFEINNDGSTALHWACAFDFKQSVKILIGHYGVDLNIRDINGETPLYAACQYENIYIVSLLLEAGANINLPDNNGKTPFIMACSKGNTTLVEKLISAGAVVKEQDNNGNDAVKQSIK